jgi:hypothetical protein
MEKDFNVDVKLAIEVKNKSVLAYLNFQNKSEKNILLNKQVTYYDGRVRNDYFEIKDSRGVCVDYLGVMSNCTRMPDEYIQLGPGETINSTIPLDEFYELKLKEGKKYKVQYCAYNPSAKDEYWGLMEMESNKVVISY